MKIRYFLMAVALLSAGQAAAQETYENAKIAGEDLNGTARYVGMGGALDALGADISTIGSNPAGIARFRKSKIEGTMSVVSQANAAEYPHGDATKVSFDQLGGVWAVASVDGSSYINAGFNFHKSRNFNLILSADDMFGRPSPDGTVYASQNKLTYMKLNNGLLCPMDDNGRVYIDEPYSSCNQLDDIYVRNLLYAAGDGQRYFYEASGYDFDRAHKGYIGEYDFNISGNINDRVYLGLTVGLHDVHYEHIGDYTEMIQSNPENISKLNVYDERRIKGQGADVKVGAIFRPIEYSPLLIGVTVHTPTWYDLTTSNYTEIGDGNNYAWSEESYDYKIYTPWKFGLSAGYTVGKQLALGFGFDYADYGTIKTRINDGGEYYFYDYYESSHNDYNMNEHTKRTLKGVSTIKVGAELKVTPELALRAGYNYATAMYEKDGFKDGTIQSNGSYISTATDFTNWKDTNRFTCGLGYSTGKFNFDIAYQYSVAKGDFSPFMSYTDGQYYDFDNVANFVEVNNKRHQLMCTMGFSF